MDSPLSILIILSYEDYNSLILIDYNGVGFCTFLNNTYG
jgi:hypothetical protein